MDSPPVQGVFPSFTLPGGIGSNLNRTGTEMDGYIAVSMKYNKQEKNKSLLTLILSFEKCNIKKDIESRRFI